MKRLSDISMKKSVFVLELKGNEAERKKINLLGILPGEIITVVQNSDQNSKILFEIDENRFKLSKDLAKKIIVKNLLDEQNLIFDSHHKKTKQRDFILQELKRQNGHFTLEKFTDEIRKKKPKIGSVTVYRTLKFLSEKGILEILELPDGTKKFELQKGHHDHILCEKCNSIIEFRNEEMEKLQKKIAKKYNVKLDSHKMNLFAKECPNCKRKKVSTKKAHL